MLLVVLKMRTKTLNPSECLLCSPRNDVSIAKFIDINRIALFLFYKLQ